MPPRERLEADLIKTFAAKSKLARESRKRRRNGTGAIDLSIDDSSLGRRILIASSGCSTAVVWNPWVEVAASMADLDDDDYRHMLCVETANAGPETVEIAAGNAYRLTAEYTIR